VFYFRPGHETYPIYYQKEVRQVVANAVRWAAPSRSHAYAYSGDRAINAVETLEKIR
jgi:trehalose utilization protein